MRCSSCSAPSSPTAATSVAAHGEAAWNGVAILSRVGLEDVVPGLAGGPGFPHQEARAVSATCGGIRVVSVYVPNGRQPGSEHYEYKLAWLASLRDMVAAGPEADVVCGDMNIAPTDDDVFDPDAYVGQTHVTAPERAALAELQALGLRDVVRDRWPNERFFSYWDYRAGMFHQDLGMRIDLVLASAPVADRVRAAWVDRQARKGKGPSDHAPVIVDLDEAPDGDIGPVVPPPSAPARQARLGQAAAGAVAAPAVDGQRAHRGPPGRVRGAARARRGESLHGPRLPPRGRDDPGRRSRSPSSSQAAGCASCAGSAAGSRRGCASSSRRATSPSWPSSSASSLPVSSASGATSA